MKNCVITLLFIALTPLLSWGYILPTQLILQKTTDNAGGGTYTIEQEVQFSAGDEFLSVKETWVVDGERALRLTVTGGKELQNSFRLQFVYNGEQRFSLVNNVRQSEKISDDFLERFLNFRSEESFAATLMQQKILPASANLKKAGGKTSADFKYEPEPWVRLSRTGGVVSYALGTPTHSEQEQALPGVWIEQDQFVVRKIRLPSQAEMVASNYSQYAKGLHYPRNRTVRWGNNTATIRLLSATARPQTPANLFQPTSLDTNSTYEGLQSMTTKDVIVEFYKRFR